VEAVDVKPILFRNNSNFSKLWFLLPLLPLLSGEWKEKNYLHSFGEEE